VSVVFPLQHNIDTQITNHILNRELEARGLDEEDVDKVKEIDNVINVYPELYKVEATSTSKELKSSCVLGRFHYDYEPTITAGRLLDESETGVGMIPKTIIDVNSKTGKETEINGEELIGKTLNIKGDSFKYKVKIVGAYDNSDPRLFDDNEIIISTTDLSKLNDTLEYENNDLYTITVNKGENVDKVSEQASDICEIEYWPLTDSSENVGIYNFAVYVLLFILAIFVFLAVTGCYVFLKYNMDNRVNEFALYRAIGYKTKHIFYLVFSEHLLLIIVSTIIAVTVSTILCSCFLSPFVLSFLENSLIHNMNVGINIIEVATVVIINVLILLFICFRFAKRSEKIDLTILLRE
jgi:ABC-type antimicrobial peptide transport system permease subunit